MPEGVEALVGLFLAFGGAVSGDQGGCALSMPEGALDEPGGDASFEQRGSVRMAEGRDGDTGCGDASSLCGCAKGALDPGATHREGRRRTVGVIPPGGRKAPGGVTMGGPGGTQQSQRLCGQRAVAVLSALATV